MNKKTPTAKTTKHRKAKAASAPPPSPAAPVRDTPASKPGRLSALSAAARVLAETGQAMNCRQLIDTMAAQGYWTSPADAPPKPHLPQP